MLYYFCRLIPPRSTFTGDMSDAERAIMQRHVAYWKEWMDRGHVIAFGPVADPAGTYGIGIVQVEQESELESFRRNDPTILADAGFRIEAFAMPRVSVPNGESRAR